GRLAGLLPGESVSGEYVRFRIAVFKAQAATLAGLGDSAPARSSGTSHQGPALRPEMLAFDAAAAERLFRSILDACHEHGDPGADLSRLGSAVAGRPELLEGLLRAAAFGPDEEHLASLADRLEVSGELLVFVGRLAAAPFVTCAVGHLVEHGAVAAASDGSCPACGSTPGLASLRPDDAGRVLCCSLCGHRWPFGRLVCPFCTGEDSPELSRLTIAGEDARWIEACDGCRNYLKTIDLGRRPEGEDFIPLVEEVAGLYLDLVAEKEGYLRKPPYAAVG
ncbi:MAG: formate dehydrogenase accessory protein FdhE, partial [Planctomycetota bacterium]